MDLRNKKVYKYPVRIFLMFFFAVSTVGIMAGVNVLAAQSQNQDTSSQKDSSEIYTVCARDCDFSNIQKAVEKAVSGDTIKIKGGKYNEEVKVDKNVTLQAYNDKNSINGGIYFSSPSLTVPNQTTVYISRISSTEKNKYPKASKKQNTTKTSHDPTAEKGTSSEDSTVSTPLFDVSIQPKEQGESNSNVIITLIIFFVIALTILGYFIFGFVVHKKRKKEKKKQ